MWHCASVSSHTGHGRHGCKPSRELRVGTRVINHSDHLFICFKCFPACISPLRNVGWKKEFVLQKKKIVCRYPPAGKQF